MTRFNFFLLLAVLASSRSIETDNKRLQVEIRAQAAPLRVEKLAKEQLQMRTVTPAITHYVSYSVDTASVARLAASASASTQPAAAVVGRIQ